MVETSKYNPLRPIFLLLTELSALGGNFKILVKKI